MSNTNQNLFNTSSNPFFGNSNASCPLIFGQPKSLFNPQEVKLFQQQPKNSNFKPLNASFNFTPFKDLSTSGETSVSTSVSTSVIENKIVKKLNLEKFNISSDRLKDKFNGIFLLSCLLSPDDVISSANIILENPEKFETFNLKTLGLHCLIKMNEENLLKKIHDPSTISTDDKNLAFIFINTLYGLIEEDIKTSKDLYSLILQCASNNKTLSYAIRLVKAHSTIPSDFFGSNPSYLESFVMAIHLFVLHDNEPQKVIDDALKFDKDVLRFVISMLGASYGSKWIPADWLKFSPNLTNLVEKFVMLQN
jgi:hypothetical protein